MNSEVRPDLKYFTAGSSVLLHSGRSETFSFVCLDSRKAAEGCLFAALKGEKTDGHLFIEAALKAGASAVIAENAFVSSNREEISLLAEKYSASILVCENTSAALQAAAALYLDEFKGLKRIGITGTSGKTTTKELVKAVLEEDYRVFASAGNLNSELGLPAEVFRLNSSIQAAVFEMGMNRRGEMAILASIVKPEYVIITNIGRAHIGPLESAEAVAMEKSKILKYAGPEAYAVINSSIPFKTEVIKDCRAQLLWFDDDKINPFSDAADLGLNGWSLVYKGGKILFPLFGRHNLMNARAAVLLAETVGISAQAVKKGLEKIKPLFGRSEVLEFGAVKLVQDCYNASPESVKSAVGFFDKLETSSRKILVLGSMLELGGFSESIHSEITAAAAGTQNISLIYLFGAEYAKAAAAYKGSSALLYFDDYSRLEAALLTEIRNGDIVLVKGARGMSLERITEAVKLKFSGGVQC
jgi:UDP-N-acetylmuramoyl-tripeptide--D-alanyl-D-alanine ligase